MATTNHQPAWAGLRAASMGADSPVTDGIANPSSGGHHKHFGGGTDPVEVIRSIVKTGRLDPLILRPINGLFGFFAGSQCQWEVPS